MTLVGLPSDTLFALAEASLAAVVNYWPASPTAPLPSRQYVSNGTVFWDCAQLAVSVERMFGMEGDVQAEQWISQTPLAGIRGCIVAIQLIRQVPDVQPGAGDEVALPTVDDITTSAYDVHADAILVWNCLLTAQQNGQLATCNDLAFQDWQSLGPEGGLAGGLTHVRLALL